MTVDALTLLERLESGDWRRAFEPRTLAAAERVRGAGRVHEILAEPTPSGVALSAEVEGSHEESYDTDVELSERAGRISIDADCSCPVGSRCKHAAAVLGIIAGWRPAEHQRLLAGPVRLGQPGTARASEPARVPPLLHWLEQIEAHRPVATTTAEPERQLLVLLRAGSADGPAGELQAALVWARPGRTGDRLVDARSLVDSPAGPQPAPAEGWPDGVAERIALLLQAPLANTASGVRWLRIDRLLSEQALVALAARYPLHFERASGPALAPAAALPLALDWQTEDDGSQRLAVRLPEATARLVLGQRLWYIDPEHGRFGPVDGDPVLVRHLRWAPKLAPEDVEAVRPGIARARGLPAPRPAPPLRRIDSPPRLLLQLRPLRLPSLPSGRGRWPEQVVGSAEVLVDYGGLRIDPKTWTRQLRARVGGELLETERDRAAEHQLQARLQRYPLRMLGDLLYGAGQWRLREVDDPYRLLLQPDRQKPPLSPADWQPTIAELEHDGVLIEYLDGFPRQRLVEVGDWHVEAGGEAGGWFDLQLGIDVDGARVDLLPILRGLLADPSFPLVAAADEPADRRWPIVLDSERRIELPLARLRALLAPLLDWLQQEPKGALRLHRLAADTLDALPATVHWAGGAELRSRLEALRGERQPLDPPAGFQATLRPYQREGLSWLDFLAAAGLGGVLADDMGLGKTVQVLAHIVRERALGRLAGPVLVVCPTSLVGNWRDEATRFAPMLAVQVSHGAERAAGFDRLADADLVITTYPLLPRDRDALVGQRFGLLVLDEAQAIKNARSQAAQVVRELDAARRLAMTGTPLENHLGELWAQIDAVEPGLLGPERLFNKVFRHPIEKHGDDQARRRLQQRIGALILRRRKADVLADLPPKTDIVRLIELADDQRSLYESLRLAQHERVREAIAERGLAQSGLVVLDALLKLRQACCDPALVKLPSARKVQQSAKREAVHELLDGLLDEGRRVLLFSQFTSMLALLAADLDARGVPYLLLTGDTPGGERAALVRRFQDGEVPLFLISLKAGGVGLNLTAADTVVHYDPWWNPAVEAQATDRAHRIGQDKPVFVFRLICAGTVEEKIQGLQQRKAALAEAVLDGETVGAARFEQDDIEALFAPVE